MPENIILFDGVCNLCNASINFIIDRDPQSHFRFAALQSEAGQALLERYNQKNSDFDSIVLLKDGRIYQKSDAALEIARGMNGLWSWLYVFKILPRFLRNALYDFIARNRYRWFGRMDACRIPTPELRARFL